MTVQNDSLIQVQIKGITTIKLKSCFNLFSSSHITLKNIQSQTDHAEICNDNTAVPSASRGSAAPAAGSAITSISPSCSC